MPIAFDTSGFQQHDQSNWFNPANGDQVSLTYFDLVPDLPAPLEDPERLRHDLAVITGEVGCLIEAHVVHLGGVPALFQIVKLPIPNQPTGQAFIASFTLPKATCSAVLKLQAVESGMTGVREAMLVSQIGFDKWVVAHPYAPELQGRLPFHVGDDPRFDPQFADHPLSRVRAWAHHIARIAQVDPRFAALPAFQPPASAAGYISPGLAQIPPPAQATVSGQAPPAAGAAQAAQPLVPMAPPVADPAQAAPLAQAGPPPATQAGPPPAHSGPSYAAPAGLAQAAPPYTPMGSPHAAPPVPAPVPAPAPAQAAPPPAPTDSGQPAPHTPAPHTPAPHTPAPHTPAPHTPATGSAQTAPPPVPAVGTTLTTVVPGIPIGGILPLWLGDEDVTYWRMTQPDLVLGKLAQGTLARFPILENRFRDIVALDADTATIMLTGRYRNDDGGVAAEMTSLVRVPAEEAYAALTTDAIKEAFDWVGRASYAAAERGEYVCIEPGGVTYREKPYVLMIVREINGQWLSLVETSPLPKDAPIWRDQQTAADTDGQMLSGPASQDAVVAGGTLALYAITTWDLHWFQLALSFGPSRK